MLRLLRGGKSCRKFNDIAAGTMPRTHVLINVMQFRVELYLIEYFGVKVVCATDSRRDSGLGAEQTCQWCYENSWRSFVEVCVQFQTATTSGLKSRLARPQSHIHILCSS